MPRRKKLRALPEAQGHRFTARSQLAPGATSDAGCNLISSSKPVTTSSHGKDTVRQPLFGRQKAMLIFYLTIPFMLLGATIAIVPLIFAMRHQHEWEDAAMEPAVRTQQQEEPLAA